jgi:hypothetical protein
MAVADTVLAPDIAICVAGESAMTELKVAVIVSEVPAFTGPFGE